MNDKNNVIAGTTFCWNKLASIAILIVVIPGWCSVGGFVFAISAA